MPQCSPFGTTTVYTTKVLRGRVVLPRYISRGIAVVPVGPLPALEPRQRSHLVLSQLEVEEARLHIKGVGSTVSAVRVVRVARIVGHAWGHAVGRRGGVAFSAMRCGEVDLTRATCPRCRAWRSSTCAGERRRSVAMEATTGSASRPSAPSVP